MIVHLPEYNNINYFTVGEYIRVEGKTIDCNNSNAEIDDGYENNAQIIEIITDRKFEVRML